MPESFDNFSSLYADNSKTIGYRLYLSPTQTNLNNVRTWAAENRIDISYGKFEQNRFKKSNKRYCLSDFLSIDGE